MKKPLLIMMIPILVLAIAVLGFFPLTGSVLFSSGTYEKPYPLSAAVEIEEKGRTHVFTLYSDGEKTLLEGNFRIGNQDYPGKLLYDGEKSYLYRPDPPQAVFYNNPAQVLYGFLPTHALDAAETTVLEEDSQGFPLKYTVLDNGQESTVTLKNPVHSAWALQGVAFSLPEGTQLINAEGFLKTG